MAAFLLTLYYFYNPVTTLWTPKCLFKVVTGLQCPGCGIQRALHALLQGRFLEAIHYNYFLLFSGPYILSFGVRALLPKGKAKDSLTKVIEDKTAYMVVHNPLFHLAYCEKHLKDIMDIGFENM